DAGATGPGGADATGPGGGPASEVPSPAPPPGGDTGATWRAGIRAGMLTASGTTRLASARGIRVNSPSPRARRSSPVTTGDQAAPGGGGGPPPSAPGGAASGSGQPVTAGAGRAGLRSAGTSRLPVSQASPAASARSSSRWRTSTLTWSASLVTAAAEVVL